ncbi:MAG: hypothetical protein IE928_08130 [Gammaproteobacteria bacterium]|nr:hypothetical protein [Gammaproteobacteria bacterium]
MLETDLDTALEHFINQEGFLPGKTTFGIEIELSTQNMGPEISWAGDPDQNARQAPSFRAGKDSADAVGVLWSVSVASVVVRCTGE